MGCSPFALADRLVASLPALEEVTVWMCSQIGQHLDRPQQIFLLTHLAPGAVQSDIEGSAQVIIREELANLPAFCRALARGERHVP
jgi:S-adenosylmethionine synthetase